MSGDKKYYVLAAAIVVILGIVIFGFGRSGTGGYSQREEQQRRAPYVNPDFHVSLEYPEFWKPDISTSAPKFNGNYLRFGADQSPDPKDNGFFGIDAVGAGRNIPIDVALQTVILPPAKPYGTNPIITSSTISGMEARMVMPSSDQPPGKDGEAILIVKYPNPIAIGSSTFYFFLLYGDKNHLSSIADTLRFVDALH